MQSQYKKALEDYTQKDRYVRDLMQRVRVHLKAGHPYFITREDVVKVNEARSAWLEFLKVARR